MGTSKIRLTKSDIEDIRRMTLAQKSTKEIAEWIGCSEPTVTRYRRSFFGTGVYKPRRFWREEEDETVARMFEEGCSFIDIGKEIGRTPEAVIVRCSRLRSEGRIKSVRPTGRKKQ